MTHDMLRNRIPLTAFRDPFGWAVLRILFPLEYMEKANRILATTPVIDQTLQTCQSYFVLYGIESTFTFGIHVMTKINEIEILHYLNQYFKNSMKGKILMSTSLLFCISIFWFQCIIFGIFFDILFLCAFWRSSVSMSQDVWLLN